MSITLTMPALSPTMTEGVVAKWHIKEGDEVAPGDVIADIETDKATMEMETVDAGRIGRILVPAGGDSVPVHTPIAILLEEGEDSASDTPAEAATAPASAIPSPSPPAQETPAPAAPSAASAAAGSAPQTGERIKASPLAKRLAREKGIDLAAIAGSGPHGRIIQRDVEAAPSAAVAAAIPSPAVKQPQEDPRRLYAPDSYEEIPLDAMRRAIARRLTQSMQEAPHYYIRADARIDLLSQARKRLNERRERQARRDEPPPLRLSINDFLLRAAALALMEFPDVNSSWAEECLLRHRHADIAIAVALPGGGLVTPIVREVESKGLGRIAAESRVLIARARERKLEPSEYQGGSFTISNLGAFGIREFTAVINPPQSAILAVGSARKAALVEADGGIRAGEILSLTLSCDHRVIDGALGARFLAALRDRLEEPASMLV